MTIFGVSSCNGMKKDHGLFISTYVCGMLNQPQNVVVTKVRFWG